MQSHPEGALDSGIANENRHRSYRYRVPSLVYVNLDQGNGGIVRDISANGIGIQAVGRLRAGQSVLTRFDLLNPRTRIEALADVVWADDSGQAGLRFAQISDRTRRGLSDWILTNLLATVDHVSARTSMFHPAAASASPLLTGALPALTTLPAERHTDSSSDSALTISLPFWPTPVSMRKIWLMMDGLLIMVGVLVFWLVFLAVARSLPSWPMTIGLACAIAVGFAFAYRLLFRVFAIESPGCYLATRAAAEETLDKIRGLETEPRFR
jgi:PilZ domain-containing protein